ncbi:MAG: hypothetical protein APF77_00565 [Clostridia bacterium BRH_c25]|nr:MAG: hypothetical protein APF77_00565 [Clostridia bacterium BRH_c25]
MNFKEVTIVNKTGLHARPASDFVKEASKYKSDIKIDFNGRSINAKSIINVLSAGLSAGSIIVISAEGDDEQQAVDGLVTLIETKLKD